MGRERASADGGRRGSWASFGSRGGIGLRQPERSARTGFRGTGKVGTFEVEKRKIMETQEAINYKRISEAIAFYKAKFKEQPSLEEVAEHIHLSPFHFQRMFKEWAGVTPKQFLQYLTLEHAKEVLKKEAGNTLADAALEAGLS